MTRKLSHNGKTFFYELQYKKVKNINLRIYSDGRVAVSANRRVPLEKIEAFLHTKAEFVFQALERSEARVAEPSEPLCTEEEVQRLILSLCDRVYPYFREKGVPFPEVRFRRMKSQWGNCRKERGVVTFNTMLCYAPTECVEYVVAHEFTHLLHPNHGAGFYAELEQIQPDQKSRKEKLKQIILPNE